MGKTTFDLLSGYFIR